MARPKRKAAWAPSAAALARYCGPVRSRRGQLLEVVAEASGNRMVVKGIGRAGIPVRFTVASKNLGEPEPQLF